MKYLALATLLGVVFGSPSATRAQPMAAPGGDRAQIEALYKTFAEAFNKKNVDEIMSIYANTVKTGSTSSRAIKPARSR